jgi:hypothetical protein
VIKSRDGRRRYGLPCHEFKAQTLEELRKACGDDGDAAVEEARHYAAMAWKMRCDDFSGGNELALHHDHIRAALNVPRIDRQPWRPALLHHSTAYRSAVIAKAHAVLAQWEEAGSPGLSRAIEQTQQLVHHAGVTAAKRQEALEAVERIIFKESPAWA